GPGIVRLHGVAALAVHVHSELELMTAAHPGDPVVHDEIVVLIPVVAALAETRADAGDIHVGQIRGFARGRRIPSAGAYDGDGGFVQQRGRESVAPAQPGEHTRVGVSVGQVGPRVGYVAVFARPVKVHVDAIVIPAQVLIHAGVPLAGRL